MNEEKAKWTTENLPKGYPTECERKELNEAIQDLSNELYKKTQEGKNNEFWRFLILNLIQSGHNELQRRNNSLIAKITLGSLIISLIAVSLSIMSLQTSFSWESNQIKMLDEQKQIQQQILEEIRASSRPE